MGSHFKSDNTHTITDKHALAHILDTCAVRFDFQLLRPFYSLSQPHHVTASNPFPGDSYHSTGGRSKRTMGQANMATINSFSHTCTRVSTLSDLSRIVSQPPPSLLCCPSPPSQHPYSLTLVSLVPVLHLLLPSGHTVLAIRYSSILSTCANHLNTL